MTRLPLAIGLVLLQAAMCAAGQTAHAQTTQTAQIEKAHTLAGPGIPATDPHTLVVYEYGGTLQPLGLPPAEAALDLLDLDTETAERIARVLTERSMLAEQLIIDNFDLVSQGETIDSSENELEKGLFVFQVVQALYPLIERGPLEDEIRPLLPPMVAHEYNAILNEYWRALGKSRVEEAKAKGYTLRLRKAIREARAQQIEKEVELAAERALESERFAIDYLLKGLDLTDTQQARIKTLIIDYTTRTMGDASEKDTERLFGEVLAYLNETQRTIIIERIKGL
ncbi:hypothetical protein MNBD_PLANCTO03-284 [hydrothermal vent metagenome]|uniref:Uncharacterized protein n=1 Tax=hydrothermal vent metagenome TaxID=652676 RepID=A0A3B1DYC8_9ZZZZ